MDRLDDNLNLTNLTAEGALRLRQLLQVWRDYYDELFEVDIEQGTFESMTEIPDDRWPSTGFLNIEVILLAEKRVHPDDKAAFSEFFDLEHIAKCIRDGIYVTKLFFRMKDKDDSYIWVKVKNIVPTKRLGERDKFFACFRRVDEEAAEDLKYKQELRDALLKEKEINRQKTELIHRFFEEIKTPINGIMGMTGIIRNQTKGQDEIWEKLKKIDDESRHMNEIIDELFTEETGTEDVEAEIEIEMDSKPVSKINYSRRRDHGQDEGADKDPASVLPCDYLYVSGDSSATTGEDIDFDFSGKKILVVEDNKLNIEVMTALLETTGASVDVAEDGKQAVIKFISQPAGTYDLILMDIGIPVLDGYRATKCIRIGGKEDSATVPIYAVTSNNFNEDVLKSYEYGFNAYFTKPVDFKVLFTKMQGELN